MLKYKQGVRALDVLGFKTQIELFKCRENNPSTMLYLGKSKAIYSQNETVSMLNRDQQSPYALI